MGPVPLSVAPGQANQNMFSLLISPNATSSAIIAVIGLKWPWVPSLCWSPNHTSVDRNYECTALPWCLCCRGSSLKVHSIPRNIYIAINKFSFLYFLWIYGLELTTEMEHTVRGYLELLQSILSFMLFILCIQPFVGMLFLTSSVVNDKKKKLHFHWYTGRTSWQSFQRCLQRYGESCDKM